MSLPNLTFALVGLPNAGSPIVVNSLINAPMQQSELRRMATRPTYIGKTEFFGRTELPNDEIDFIKHDLKTASGQEYGILNLPNLWDTKGKLQDGEHFDENSKACVVQCDVILWVSNIQTAFLTAHERDEFVALIKFCDDSTRETGRLYQFGIVLSKLNFDIRDDAQCKTMTDSHRRIVEMFPEMHIIKYNAFGRIQYCSSPEKSQELVQLVQTSGECVFNINTEWSIEVYWKDFADKKFQIDRNFMQYMLSMIEHAPNCEGDSMRPDHLYFYTLRKSYFELHTTPSFIVLCRVVNRVLGSYEAGEKNSELCSLLADYAINHKFDIVCISIIDKIAPEHKPAIATNLTERSYDESWDPYANYMWLFLHQLHLFDQFDQFDQFDKFNQLRKLMDLTNVIARTAPQRYSDSSIIIDDKTYTLHNRITPTARTLFTSYRFCAEIMEPADSDVNKIFRFDVDLCVHPARSALTKWQDEVHAERVRLYGEDNDCDINTLITLIYRGHLNSLMQRID